MKQDSLRNDDGWEPFGHDTVPGVLYSLVTDEGAPIVSQPAKPIDYDPDGTRRKRFRDKDDAKHAAGGYLVDESGETIKVTDQDSNCHGTTFGGGAHYVDVPTTDTILRDNYLRVDLAKGQRARVCDVIVWGGSHSATIVEVDANGKPTVVIGKNTDLGRLWAHPPDDYGKDWEVHARRGPLDAATAAEVDALKTAYDAAKNASDADPANDALRRRAHLAAYRLCRRKNKLKDK